MAHGGQDELAGNRPVPRGVSPLLEFDESTEVLLDPVTVMAGARYLGDERVPAGVVMCFFREVVAGLVAQGICTEVVELFDGRMLYAIEWRGQPIGLIYPGAGAPLAAGVFEELIAMGCRRAMACGSAGAIGPGTEAILLVSSALRDEGLSHHYFPASRTIDISASARRPLADALSARALPYLVGRTWTTDGVYRETFTLRDKRIVEECRSVEMECAALSAIALYRQVLFAQVLVLPGRLEAARLPIGDPASIRTMLFEAAADAVCAPP